MNNIIKKAYKGVFAFSLLQMILSVILIGKLSKNNDEKDTNIKIVYEMLENTSELKLYFQEKVTFDIVRNSLENNSLIDDEYRTYTNEFINLIEKRFPDIDLTILNENIKVFSVSEIKKEDMQKERKREAYYDIKTISIVMHDEHENINNKKYCYFHELWHMFNNLYFEKDGIIYYKNPIMFSLAGTAFDEGMNTFLTKQISTSSLNSYARQYDEIKILYSIFGEELIKTYLDSGIEGIQLLLSEKIGFDLSYNLIQYMNDELEKINEDPLPIYKILLELYFNHNDGNVNHEIMVETLGNLLYSREVKKEILTLFYDSLPQVGVTDDWSVTFDNEKYYKLKDLYFIECGDIEYLVTNDTLVEFFNTGIIKNIYDIEGVDQRGLKIKMRSSLLEYLKYYGENFTYDEENHVVYIDGKLRGGSYVKSK